MPTITVQTAVRLGLAVLLALLLAAVFIMRSSLAECRAARQTEQAAHAISNASVARLQATVAKMTADQKKLAADDANRMAETAEALEMVRAADRWRTAAIDRLNTSAATMGAEGGTANSELCEASDAVKAVWQ